MCLLLVDPCPFQLTLSSLLRSYSVIALDCFAANGWGSRFKVWGARVVSRRWMQLDQKHKKGIRKLPHRLSYRDFEESGL